MDSNLIDFIKDSIKNKWEVDQFPLLTSELGNRLSYEQRQAIGLPLTQWLEKNLDSLNAKIVVHPKFTAKIGLIPKDKDFLFENQDINNETSVNKKRDEKDGVIELLSRLERLSSEEMASISIPLNVVIKLLK